MDFLGASYNQAAAMRPDWDLHERNAFGSPGRLLGVVAGLCDTASDAEVFFRHECPWHASASVIAVRSRALPTWSEYVRS